MGHADIASGEHEVINILRIDAAVGNAEGRYRIKVFGGFTVVVETLGRMIIHLPAAVGDDVIVMGMHGHFVLGQDVVTDAAHTLPLAGQIARPIQLPVFTVMAFGIFNMIPGTVGESQQFMFNVFAVVQGVAFAAHLQPPEVCSAEIAKVVTAGLQILFGELADPTGRGKGNGLMGLPHLDHKRVAHGAAVSLNGSRRFVKLRSSLAALAIFGAGKLCQNAVAGAVDEQIGGDLVGSVGGQLPAGDFDDLVIFGL